MIVERFINEPVPSNCYVLYENNANGCIIVDPGSKDCSRLLSFLSDRNLNASYIILTHEHFDHCWGVKKLEDEFQLPIICSSLCADCISDERRNCSAYYNNDESFSIQTDTISTESLNYHLFFFGKTLHFILTPGHTDASLSFVVEKKLFTGDSLIKNKRTYTKLPTGSEEKVMESMIKFGNMLGKGYIVYPGHGEPFNLDGYDLKRMIHG